MSSITFTKFSTVDYVTPRDTNYLPMLHQMAAWKQSSHAAIPFVIGIIRKSREPKYIIGYQNNKPAETKKSYCVDYYEYTSPFTFTHIVTMGRYENISKEDRLTCFDPQQTLTRVNFIADRFLKNKIKDATKWLDIVLREPATTNNIHFLVSLADFLYFYNRHPDKKPTASVEICTKVLGLIPLYAPAKILLARISLDRNEIEKAIQILEETLEHQPKFKDALCLLSDIYITLRPNMEKAEMYLRQGIATYSMEYYFHKTLGLMLFNQQTLNCMNDELKEAKNLLTRVLSSTPHDTEILSPLAEIAFLEGDFPKAQEHFMVLQELKPNNAHIQTRLQMINEKLITTEEIVIEILDHISSTVIL